MDASTMFKDKKSLATVIAGVLEGMVNPDAPHMPHDELAKFGMADDPIDMPLGVFMESLLQVCTPTEAVCGLLYIRRLLKAPLSLDNLTPIPSLTRYNVHRIMFTAVILANVQWNDVPFSTGAWARWSTVWSRSTVENMKMLFLKGMDWRLHLQTPDFETAVAELDAMMKSNCTH
eukprot:Rmarinus@m.29820